MSDMTFVGTEAQKTVRVAEAPVYNQLCSMCLLSQDHLDRISTWVDVTRQHMTDRDRKRAMMACEAVPFIMETGASSLEDLLTELKKLDPKTFLEVKARRLVEKAKRHADDGSAPGWEEVASNRDAFVGLVREMYVKMGEESEFDRAKEEEAFDRLKDGASYRIMLVEAIETLWNQYLKDEWPHVAPTSATAVEAFNSIELPGGSFADQIKYITERDELPEMWMDTFNDASEVVFIPSVHIGPFMILIEFDGTTAYVVGRARIPEGSAVHASELDRSELLIRLEALSDDTRLRVLQMASEQPTITTAEVMERLDLSQSSASRHLSQLRATGLLSVDSSARTKHYRVNRARVDQVFSGLKELLGHPR